MNTPRNHVNELIERNVAGEFSRSTAKGRVKSLFGNVSQFSVGMGLGNKFGAPFSFPRKEMGFGMAAWMKQRGG